MTTQEVALKLLCAVIMRNGTEPYFNNGMITNNGSNLLRDINELAKMFVREIR